MTPMFLLSMLGIIEDIPIDQQLVMLEAEDDLQNLGNFAACSYTKMPQSWPFFDFDH